MGSAYLSWPVIIYERPVLFCFQDRLTVGGRVGVLVDLEAKGGRHEGSIMMSPLVLGVEMTYNWNGGPSS